MHISEQLSDDFKTALKSGDKNKLSILRMVKAAVKNREIEKSSPLDDEEIYGILRSFVKRAHESIEQFSKAGRQELADKEKEELAIIQNYLPRQLGETEIGKIVEDVIGEIGATGPKDIGRVMKAVMSKTKGLADGKIVNELVKQTLERINAA
ncbi:MAG: GatB/YqeY domain-containing protein [Nitrospiraceae bacterium]|nr:MAG: GatB/YqeY domain-containing protein [Nitrospiraceae bacterium]